LCSDYVVELREVLPGAIMRVVPGGRPMPLADVYVPFGTENVPLASFTVVVVVPFTVC